MFEPTHKEIDKTTNHHLNAYNIGHSLYSAFLDQEMQARGIDLTVPEAGCQCETFSPHKVVFEATKHEITQRITINGLAVNLPFALSPYDAEQVTAVDYNLRPEILSDIGLYAFRAMAHGSTALSGLETITFSRYSAFIGFSPLRDYNEVKNEIFQVFRKAGCAELSILESRKPIGFAANFSGNSISEAEIL